MNERKDNFPFNFLQRNTSNIPAVPGITAVIFQKKDFSLRHHNILFFIMDILLIGKISVVRLCIDKYNAGGIEAALHDNRGRGRKAEITDSDITWVINRACQKPKDFGYSAELWYPTSFTRFINSTAGQEGHPRMATVAETTLRKILANARIRPFKVSYYCEKRESEAF